MREVLEQILAQASKILAHVSNGVVFLFHTGSCDKGTFVMSWRRCCSSSTRSSRSCWSAWWMNQMSVKADLLNNLLSISLTTFSSSMLTSLREHAPSAWHHHAEAHSPQQRGQTTAHLSQASSPCWTCAHIMRSGGRISEAQSKTGAVEDSLTWPQHLPHGSEAAQDWGWPLRGPR